MELVTTYGMSGVTSELSTVAMFKSYVEKREQRKNRYYFERSTLLKSGFECKLLAFGIWLQMLDQAEMNNHQSQYPNACRIVNCNASSLLCLTSPQVVMVHLHTQWLTVIIIVKPGASVKRAITVLLGWLAGLSLWRRAASSIRYAEV